MVTRLDFIHIWPRVLLLYQCRRAANKLHSKLSEEKKIKKKLSKNLNNRNYTDLKKNISKLKKVQRKEAKLLDKIIKKELKVYKGLIKNLIRLEKRAVKRKKKIYSGFLDIFEGDMTGCFLPFAEANDSVMPILNDLLKGAKDLAKGRINRDVSHFSVFNNTKISIDVVKDFITQSKEHKKVKKNMRRCDKYIDKHMKSISKLGKR